MDYLEELVASGNVAANLTSDRVVEQYVSLGRSQRDALFGRHCTCWEHTEL
jgi:hypothetical protein